MEFLASRRNPPPADQNGKRVGWPIRRPPVMFPYFVCSFDDSYSSFECVKRDQTRIDVDSGLEAFRRQFLPFEDSLAQSNERDSQIANFKFKRGPASQKPAASNTLHEESDQPSKPPLQNDKVHFSNATDIFKIETKKNQGDLCKAYNGNNKCLNEVNDHVDIMDTKLFGPLAVWGSRGGLSAFDLTDEVGAPGIFGNDARSSVAVSNWASTAQRTRTPLPPGNDHGTVQKRLPIKRMAGDFLGNGCPETSSGVSKRHKATVSTEPTGKKSGFEFNFASGRDIPLFNAPLEKIGNIFADILNDDPMTPEVKGLPNQFSKSTNFKGRAKDAGTGHLTHSHSVQNGHSIPNWGSPLHGKLCEKNLKRDERMRRHEGGIPTLFKGGALEQGSLRKCGESNGLFVGLNWASGSKLKVSDNARAKALSLFDGECFGDLGYDTSGTLHDKNDTNSPEMSEKNSQGKSNKGGMHMDCHVGPTEKRVEHFGAPKTQNGVDDAHNEVMDSITRRDDCMTPTPMRSAVPSLQTADGRSVRISSSKLAAAFALFGEDAQQLPGSFQNQPHSTPPCQSLHSTPVPNSEQLVKENSRDNFLCKAQNHLDVSQRPDPGVQNKEREMRFPVLETGGGNKVSVSNSGMLRAKATLGIDVSEARTENIGHSDAKFQNVGGSVAGNGGLTPARGAGSVPVRPQSSFSAPPVNITPQSKHNAPVLSSSLLAKARPVTPQSTQVWNSTEVKTPCTALGALASLSGTSTFRQSGLRTRSRLEKRTFTHPRRSGEPPPKLQGKSRRSWMPLVPRTPEKPPTFLTTPTAAQKSPVHNLYKEIERKSLAQYFGPVLQTPSCGQDSHTLTDPHNAGQFSFEGGECAKSMMARLINECGCNPDKLSENWVENHYRWIVWKLASYDAQPGKGVKHLTTENVFDELKYRYETEYRQGCRSVLHKVLEHDQAPSCPMVLLVANVTKENIPEQTSTGKGSTVQVKVELADGWYSINALPDPMLCTLFLSNSITVGDKIRVTGATIHSDRPDDPLLSKKYSTLNIHYNGVHPAKWDTPLGLCMSDSPCLVALSLLHKKGGPVSSTALCIVRKYPVLYWDKLPSGGGVVFTSKARDRARQVFEKRAVEIEAEASLLLHKEEVGGLGVKSRAGELSDVEKMYLEMLKRDGNDFMGNVTESLQAEFERYVIGCKEQNQRRCQELVRKRIQGECLHEVGGNRYIRILVHEVRHEQQSASTPYVTAMLKVWRPGEDVDRVNEGDVYVVHGVNVCGRIDGNKLDLQSHMHTRWEFLAKHNTLPGKLATSYQPRRTLPLSDFITNLSTANPTFDYEGCVILAGKVSQMDINNAQQWVFMVDESVNEIVSETPCLLAIKIVGGASAVDFLDTELECGVGMKFKDLEFKHKDDAYGLWAVDATDVSSHEYGRSRNNGEMDSHKWMGDLKVLQGLRERIDRLVGSV